jgi:two-component system, NtrC family, response regulator AtoC
MTTSVLLVDDEPVFRMLAEEALSAERFEVRTAEDLRQARREMDLAAPDILILDRRLPDGDGIDFLKALRKTESPSMIVLVLTAYGDVQNAVDALKAGASDYLTKPVQLTDLLIKLRKVLEARGLRDRLTIARNSAAGPPTLPSRSPAMQDLAEKLRSVSLSPLTPVFMHGPSGAGKQRAAEMLHALTWPADPDAPFVEVNCAALPDDLVESELFGHEKGAFTDAKTTRRGLIEMAAGGTLFLDEITEMPLRSQAKLLKFLDSMRFRRLGGQREIAVDLRVVAATNQDVEPLVRAGRFREDLYHRLAVFVLTVPSLAARRSDVADLARSFVEFFATRLGKRGITLSADALAALGSYDYPGNVRELRNIIEHAVILSPGPQIAACDIVLPDRRPRSVVANAFLSLSARPDGTPPTLAEVDRAYVARVLDHCGGHRTAAAQALGISYPTLLKRLRELNLDADAGPEDVAR